MSRWELFDTSTNDHGITFFTISCGQTSENDGDYRKLASVLKRQFNATEAGEAIGPYSVHKFFKIEGLKIGIVLDDPGWLELYAVDKKNTPAMTSLAARIVETLNQTSPA